MVRRRSPRRLAFRAWALLPLCAALLSSCSGELNPVDGKVLYKGNPIKGAVVILHPDDDKGKATNPSGVTAADGTFTLATGKEGGARPGRYTVTVLWYKEQTPSGKITMEPPQPEDQLNGRYANPASSKIKVEIKTGVNHLEPIVLE